MAPVKVQSKTLEGIHNHLVWVGVGFVLLYWFIESALHNFFFDGGPFLLHIIDPESHELWMRLFVVVLVMTFSLYAQNVVTHRRKIEQALVERDKDSQQILESNPAAIILVDCESRVISYANHKALDLVESTPAMLFGQKCHQQLCRMGKDGCPGMGTDRGSDISEREILTSGGKIVPVLQSQTIVQYQGRPHFLEAFFDITLQKRMQQDLRQAHAELNQIFQTATVGMRLIDHDFNIIKVNEAFSKLSGIAPEEAIGRKCHDVFTGNMCHTSDCSLQRVLAGNELSDYEVSKNRSDGSVVICNLAAARFEASDGTIGVVEAFKDITAFKRIQSELQSERDRLHRILFHQFEMVGIVSSGFILEYRNELLEELTGGRQPAYCYEVFCNRSAPCESCLMQQALVSDTIQRGDFDTVSGSSFQHTYTPFIDTNGQKKALISRRDITETKASMASAINSERLAALGELAAGVAHEINNPINGIINYAQILANKTGKELQLNEIANRVIKEGDRIAAIVAGLLSFSRQENGGRNLVSVRDLLQELLTLTGAQIRKDGIQLALDMADDLPPVLASPQEIERVFLNIINNSRYALNEKFPHSTDEKKLRIAIDAAVIDGRSSVAIGFEDNGVGIPPLLIEKVMNPFFSTKPPGKGTGLGLSISKRIIENHGGRFFIESVDGDYTKVTIQLPALQDGSLHPTDINLQ